MDFTRIGASADAFVQALFPGRKPKSPDEAAADSRFLDQVSLEAMSKYKKEGLRSEMGVPHGAHFHSWREWCVWGLAIYYPPRHFAGGLIISLWLPTLLLAIYPTVAFIRGPLRRRRRRQRGLCVKCGYDLRGTVSGVCSECGAACGPKERT